MLAGSLWIQMGMDIARLAADLNQTKGMVGSAMKSVESAVGTAKSILASLGAGLSVAVIINKVDAVIDGMEKLQDASEKTGASVENLSKLQFFAGVSGSNIDAVTTALAKLSKGMVSTEKESAPTTQALKFLGLSAKDAAGNLKDPSALFTEISQKLIQYEDGAGKAAIAQALFGKAGAELLPTLKKMAELGDIEASVTTAQAQAAENYGVALGRLQRQKDALWNVVVSELIPSMQTFVEIMLSASKQTDSLHGTVKGLAADRSLTNWADDVVMAMAFVVDAAVGAKDAIMLLANATVSIMEVGVAAQQAGRGAMTLDFRQMSDAITTAETAMARFDAVADKTLNRPQFRDEVGKAIAARKANAEDAARDMEGASRAAAPGKQLNFGMGDTKAGAKVAAAELKLYQGAVKGLENQLGDLNNATESQKLAFAMYGKEMSLADGSAIHLTGSLETLSAARKKVLTIMAAEIDARRALKESGDELAKLQAEVDALEKYAAMAAEAREATERFRAGKANTGQPPDLSPDVTAFVAYAGAAIEALAAEEKFRAGKGAGGDVASFVGDMDAFGAYAEAAEFARGASIAFQRDGAKIESGADLRSDVAEFARYAASADGAWRAGAAFLDGKGRAGKVASFDADAGEFAEYARAAGTAANAGRAFLDGKGIAGDVPSFGADVGAFGTYADAADGARLAVELFKESKVRPGTVASFAGDVEALAEYRDAAAGARAAFGPGLDLRQDVAELGMYAQASQAAGAAGAIFLAGRANAGPAVNLQADIGAMEGYASMAGAASDAAAGFLAVKGAAGPVANFAPDVAAFGTFVDAASDARRVDAAFRTDKGRAGAVVKLDADVAAYGEYAGAAGYARAAAISFQLDHGKAVPGADLQQDVVEFGKFAAAATGAMGAEREFRTGKGRTGDVATFSADAAEFAKYALAAAAAGAAGSEFLSGKGREGQASTFAEDVAAFASYSLAADSAGSAGGRFLAGKGQSGSVVGFDADVDAFAQYEGAAGRAMAAYAEFARGKGRPGTVADLQGDVVEYGRYAAAAGGALSAGTSFIDGKGQAGKVASFAADVTAYSTYASAAWMAMRAGDEFLSVKGGAGDAPSFAADVGAYEAYAGAAVSALQAGDAFRESKGRPGSAATFDADVAGFEKFAKAVDGARAGSVAFTADRGRTGTPADLQPDVLEFGKYAGAAQQAHAAGEVFKAEKGRAGASVDLQPEIAAFAKYADAAAHAKETERLFQIERGKFANEGQDTKARLIAEAQASDLLAMKKALLTETSKNYADALRSEVAASLQLSMGAAAATAYGDAIVKLQTGQLAALKADEQRTFMLSALSKTISDANIQTARETTALQDNAGAIALDIEMLGQDRLAAQYTAAAKMKLALANKMVEDSYRESAIAAAENVDSMNKIKDAVSMGVQLAERTKQLQVDMIMDDRQRAQAQIRIETEKHQQLLAIAEQGYAAKVAASTEADAKVLAATRKSIDETKLAMADYAKAINDKQAADEFAKLWSTAEATGKQVFVNLLSHGQSAMKGIGESIKAYIIDLLYQITLKRWMISIGANITDSMGLTRGAAGAANAAGATNAAGGGFGGIGDLFSVGRQFMGPTSFEGGMLAGYDVAGLFGGSLAAGGGAAATVGTSGIAAGAVMGEGLGAMAGGAAAGMGAGMATIGAAIPWVGAALFAANALGLFDDDEEAPPPAQIRLNRHLSGYSIGQLDIPDADNIRKFAEVNKLLNDATKFDPSVLENYVNQWVGGAPMESVDSMIQKLLGTLEPARASAEAIVKTAEDLASLTAAFNEMQTAIRVARDPLGFWTGKMHELQTLFGTATGTVEKWQTDSLSLEQGDLTEAQLAKWRELGQIIGVVQQMTAEFNELRDSIKLARDPLSFWNEKAKTLQAFFNTTADSVEEWQAGSLTLKPGDLTTDQLAKWREFGEVLKNVSDAAGEAAKASAAFYEMRDAIHLAQDPVKFWTGKMLDLQAFFNTTAGTVEKWQSDSLTLKPGDLNEEQLTKWRELGDVIAQRADAIGTAYERMNSELDEMAGDWRDAADGLRAYGATLRRVGDRGMAYAASASTFAITAAQSRAGDLGAMQSLEKVSENFRMASLESASSGLAYARDLALIQSAVGDSATVAERHESAALQHIDVLRSIVQAQIDTRDAAEATTESLEAMRLQIDQLRTSMDSNTRQSKRTADVLEGASIGGFPLTVVGP